MELFHHGIKGQRWGVRRYQNKDGTRTPEGKARRRFATRMRSVQKTKALVDEIIGSMSKEERYRLLAGDDYYLSVEQGGTVCKRVLKQIGDIPVAFIDVFDQADGTLNIALGTRAGEDYRNKGYASEVTDKALKWIDRSAKKIGAKEAVWGVKTDNIGSIRIAKKYGFVIDETSYSDDGEWVNYVKKL